ncbi:unnamed protein product [Vicia faba]|uniref:WRKY domain-containing protein n=1 Tax=Vicia faba TaxID=3906 RepID=A0AAV1ANV6_VICFA|nr:unnamed protein product [Vicia faba]
MENSSASAFFDDIPNNMNQESYIVDFPFSPALPSCSVFDIPPPPSPLFDYHNVNDASFAGNMDLLISDDFDNSWFSNYNFETGTSESLPAATQTDMQLPPLPVLSPTANPAAPVSGSSLNTSLWNEAGVVANKPVAAVAENAENGDGVKFVEGKNARGEAEDSDGDRRIQVVENGNDQTPAKKPLKQKKNDKKKKRTRVTFMTETGFDYLDDGYRWRKYGQKPIKNSPFPRSYYRCTTRGCGVKKHIERYAAEPLLLLTTYEGKHTHLPPKVTRATHLEIMNDAIADGVRKIHHNQIKTNGLGVAGNQFAMSQLQQQQFQNLNQNVILHRPALSPLSNNNDYNNSFNIAPTVNVNSANNIPPLNVVNSSSNHNSQLLNVVNSSAAHNSPPLNVVNSGDKFINSSTTFSEFLQNLGGCNFSMFTDDLTSNNGLLQDMIMPMK